MTESSGTLTLLHLLGAVAVLLWGLSIVRTGATRALGARLRVLLGAMTAGRVRASLFGLGAAVVLQSSTAVVLLVAPLAASVNLPLASALAVALGADLGTTLAVQVLVLDLGVLAPVAALAGFALYRGAGTKAVRNAGRAILGVALILIALHLMREASVPIRQSPLVQSLLSALAGEPVLAVLVAAALTWLCHSSLAVVLLVVSLAEAGHLGGPLGLLLVLGANLGAGLPAFAACPAQPPAARRIALGNLLMRGIGVLAALPFVAPAHHLLAATELSPGQELALGHAGFNALLLLAWLPLCGFMARSLERLVPDATAGADPAWEGLPRHLDRAALETPSLALASAQREALRMGDIVRRMLEDAMRAFDVADPQALISRVKAMDDAVDSLNEAIKFYLTDLARVPLTAEESRRCMTIFKFSINLEHIGDIIDRNVMKLAARKGRDRLAFSKEGRGDLRALHGRLVSNLELACNIFLAADDELAGQLVEEKRVFGAKEREAMERHLSRLRSGNAESIETSAIHLDLLRDFKRVNSHIAAVAYSVLNGERQALIGAATGPEPVSKTA